MSMGGGGGRQMPMASNQGQQMQNPQMGQQGMMGQMPPGGMFGQGGTSMMTNPNMAGQIAPMQVGQQVGGGMGSTPSFANQQGYDNFMAQRDMQGLQDRMSGIGGLFFGNGNADAPYPVGGQTPQQGMTKQQIFEMYGGLDRGPGVTMIDDSGMFRPRIGTQGPGDGGAPRGPYPINDMPLPRPDNVLVSKPPGDLPGRGMPPGYGPTKGPIDGRKLRDMMDIRTRRPMDNLPNALENILPPSLKRPTQNRRG